MSGKMIELPTPISPLAAYQVGDESSHRGLLLFHEWWGLKIHNRRLADHFAKLGYLVLIPDLYDGRLTDSSEEASRWMTELSEEQEHVDEKIRAAVHYLSHNGQRKLATYGCSMGGRQSLLATLNSPNQIQATIMAFCRMESNPAKLAPLQGPVLVIYAEQESNWPEKQRLFEAAMTTAGKVTESVSYNAAHGFTNPESSRYDSVADQAHLEVVEAFLGRHLE